MFKKLFALATLTALTGLSASTMMSGCSSSDNDNNAGDLDASADAARDARPGRDATVAEEDDAGEPEGICPPPAGSFTVADLEQELGVWKPAVLSAACTQENIDALKAALASGSATFASIKTALGATCGACAFGKPTDANWKPIIEVGQGAIINWGACFGAYSGSDECGRGITYGELCTTVLCNDEDCGSQQAQRSCMQKIFSAGGDCAEVGTAQAQCGQDEALFDTCGSIVSNIAYVCGGGPDGGLDASN